MYKLTHSLFLVCETPLHAGSGDDLGIVDLPIQRERHTSFPKIESSSLKGALRESFEQKVNSRNFLKWDDPEVKVHRVFGFDDGSLGKPLQDQLKSAFKYKVHPDDKEEKDGNEFAGCLAFSDARLLFFPVKSMKGVFAWVTCPQVLNKFAVDLELTARKRLAHLDSAKKLDVKDGECLVAESSVCINNSVVLEEYAFTATVSDAVKNFAIEIADLVFDHTALAYWCGLFKTNLVILSNNDFRDFVNQSTEVITRTKIDNTTGTVQDGALFTEEYLPTDSVMYALVMASKEYSSRAGTMTDQQVMEFYSEYQPEIFQLGGNASIGKGLLRTRLLTA